MNRRDLEKNVSAAIGQLVKEKGYFCFVDLFMKLGYLSAKDYEDWRRRRVSCLERVIKVNLARISFIMKSARRMCMARGLKPSFTGYRSWGKGQKKALRFSKSGNPHIEQAYATHFVSSRLRLAARAAKESKRLERLARDEATPANHRIPTRKSEPQRKKRSLDQTREDSGGKRTLTDPIDVPTDDQWDDLPF